MSRILILYFEMNFFLSTQQKVGYFTKILIYVLIRHKHALLIVLVLKSLISMTIFYLTMQQHIQYEIW